MRHSGISQDHFKSLMEEFRKKPGFKKFTLDEPGSNSLAAWFLGPKAENQEFFKKLLLYGIDANCEDRTAYYPEDPPFVTPYRKDAEYEAGLQKLEEDFKELLSRLKGSVPFFSYRYQAHMNWDLTMSGLLAYFSAMLYNQNNVALEASPVTSELESVVGDDLCKMLGFPVPPPEETTALRPWGHITCDGSIANFEAMWAARNLKFYAISLAEALKNDPALASAKALTVEYRGKETPLVDLDTWALLNIKNDIMLNITNTIHEQYQISSDVVSAAMDPYLVQSMGLMNFSRTYLADIPQPVVIGTATKHYSWPKNAAALGVGKDNFINIPIDPDARMRIENLRDSLENCFMKKQPVIMVLAVLGSTEESAVDPLKEVLALRDETTEMR